MPKLAAAHCSHLSTPPLLQAGGGGEELRRGTTKVVSCRGEEATAVASYVVWESEGRWFECGGQLVLRLLIFSINDLL